MGKTTRPRGVPRPDTARAVEGYRRLVDLWANADARGRVEVRRAEARLAALGEDPAVQAAGR